VPVGNIVAGSVRYLLASDPRPATCQPPTIRSRNPLALPSSFFPVPPHPVLRNADVPLIVQQAVAGVDIRGHLARQKLVHFGYLRSRLVTIASAMKELSIT
jgi:hypothetical protein